MLLMGLRIIERMGTVIIMGIIMDMITGIKKVTVSN